MAEGSNNPTWGVPGFEAVPDFASTVAAAVMGLTWAMEGCGSDEIDAVDAMSDRYADVQKIVSEALADFGKVPAPTPDAGSDLGVRVRAALAQKHTRQIGPNPLSSSCDLLNQFAHLSENWKAGYGGYLTPENFHMWAEDFAAALTPASQPPGEDLARQGEPLAAWIRRAIMANLKGEADGVDEAVAVIVSNLKASAPDLAGQGEPVANLRERLGQPHCWVLPGQDTANCNGYIDAHCCEEGELSKPLWSLESIRDAIAAPAPSRPADRSSVTAEEIAMVILERCGFGFYTDPMEGGQAAYDISCEALDEADAILKLLTLRDAPRNGGDGTQTLYNKLDGDSLDYICEVIGSPALYNKGKSAMRTWFLARLREAWGIAEKKDGADA